MKRWAELVYDVRCTLAAERVDFRTCESGAEFSMVFVAVQKQSGGMYEARLPRNGGLGISFDGRGTDERHSRSAGEFARHGIRHHRARISVSGRI